MLVSNNAKCKFPNEETLSIDAFLAQAGSDEGLDFKESDLLYLDVNAFDQDTFMSIYEILDDKMIVFTSGTSGDIPNYLEGNEIPTWEDLKSSLGIVNENAATKEAPESADAESTAPGSQDVEIQDETDGFPTEEMSNLINNEIYSTDEVEEIGNKEAVIFCFGSAKGGSGKTFTSLISAYRYAKTHPNQRVAHADFDIIDGQVGISIHKTRPTMRQFYGKYMLGYDDYTTMAEAKVKSDYFPTNLDFYLAPKESADPIKDDEFWDRVYYNLITNYDVVFFDTGIDYLNTNPITNIYKIADKIVLTTTTSIKSVSSVSKQVTRLRGDVDTNGKFTKEDGLAEKIGVVITRARPNNTATKTAIKTFETYNVKILAAFGVLDESIEEAEYFGNWGIFDKNDKFNKNLDKIFDM